MRHFSVAPSLTLQGRTRKGLRGMAGKPFHPPLTDIPIAAYLFAAVFDVLSGALHSGHQDVAEQLYRAGTWTILGGAAVSVLAALTGWADWHRSSTPGTQARRTANTHALTMVTVTVLTIVNLVLRLTAFHDHTSTPLGMARSSRAVISSCDTPSAATTEMPCTAPPWTTSASVSPVASSASFRRSG